MASGGYPLTGGCFCGDVRYAVDASAPMVAWFSVKPEAFRITAGAPVLFASSETGMRQFCGRCGAQLTFQDGQLDEIDITTASLDDPSTVPPTDQIWIDRRLSWMSHLNILPELPRGHSAAVATLNGDRG
jgi:hypothetical protein